MQRKQLAAGVACALLSAVIVFAYTASVSSEARSKRSAAIERYGGEQVEVLVAAEDIHAGQEVKATAVQLRTWVVDLLPQAEVATSAAQVEGLYAEADIREGEPILLERVGEGSSRITVPDGLEAVSIASDDVLAVGGAIKAGSFVDVYVETSTDSVALLGQMILVLDTSVIASGSDGGASLTWVTLAVTEDSVEELIAASAHGTIHLALPGSQS